MHISFLGQICTSLKKNLTSFVFLKCTITCGVQCCNTSLDNKMKKLWLNHDNWFIVILSLKILKLTMFLHFLCGPHHLVNKSVNQPGERHEWLECLSITACTPDHDLWQFLLGFRGHHHRILNSCGRWIVYYLQPQFVLPRIRFLLD